jgi:dephospho-CoA kinase
MPRPPQRRRAFSPRGRRRDPAAPWKFGAIPVIGVVGGIGAGKSRVSEALAARGAFVVDADHVGHALLDQKPARELVAQRFGEAILTPKPTGEDTDPQAAPHEPSVDRKALGALVFADPSARHDLEVILHPRMRATFLRAIDRAMRRPRYTAVVLDAAVLFEAGWDNLCDLILFVDASDAMRLARVRETRGWTESDLQAREAAQWTLDRKRSRSTQVIPNQGSLDQLEAAVTRFWEKSVVPRSRSATPVPGSKPAPSSRKPPQSDEPKAAD